MTFYGLNPKSKFPRGTTWRSRPHFVYSSSRYYKNCRRIAALLVLAAICFLLRHLAAFPKTDNNVGSDRRTPDLSLDSLPHFLHHSAFREEPDADYESRLEEAFQRIERRESAKSDGQSDHIWQIMLRKSSRIISRSVESQLFQDNNPEWGHTIVSNEWATDFITNTLSSVPDLADIYKSYPSDVLRADLLRYLILWYYGGFYADMDVHPARSINGCPALQTLLNHQQKHDISLVLGVEIDEPYASPKLLREWRWSRSYQFIQYVLYAPRRFSPLLRRAVVRALAHTKRHNDASSWIFGPRYNEKTTLEVTGPGLFTDAILDTLSETLPSTHPLIRKSVEADEGVGDLMVPAAKGANSKGDKDSYDLQMRYRLTWAPFHGLTTPLWVDASEAMDDKEMGGLGVLPINVWGNGQRHSGAENFFSEHACVNHRFGGSWKKWKKGWLEYLLGR